MKKGQTSIRNGIEDILFPMEVCNITQGDNVGTHRGTCAVDLAGKDTGRCIAYFPFNARSVALDSKVNGNAVIWESINKVRFADGTVDYCCMMVIHDNDSRGFEVGKSYKQGQQMAQEGTAGNANGNHLHIEVKKGKFEKGTYGMYDRNVFGVYHMRNNIPIEKACFMDGTTIKQGVANWKYLKDVLVSVPSTGKKLYLPASAKSWRVYSTSAKIVNGIVQGGAIATLNPAQYGGLTYDVLGYPGSNFVTIQTSMFGRVNIYVGSETGAVIK